MAKFTVEERIEDGSNSAQIWARLRQYVLDGKTVELTKRTIDGEIVFEVRRWGRIRTDGSNRASASPEVDY